MEAKIMDVLRRMQPVLDEMQLRELKEALQMTFTGYHELGGNGMVTKMKQEIDELHLKQKGE